MSNSITIITTTLSRYGDHREIRLSKIKRRVLLNYDRIIYHSLKYQLIDILKWKIDDRIISIIYAN
jgi:hypothetical protein